MSLQRLIINTGDLTADGFKSVCDLSPLALPAAVNFENYIGALCGGLQSALLSFNVGAVQATATLTSTGAATALQTCTVCNVTLTAVSATPGDNEFVVSGTVGTQATNIAAAINASTTLSGKVTATSLLGVVTITAVVPGLMGNGLEISAGTLSNVAAGAFANGTDGTAYSVDLR